MDDIIFDSVVDFETLGTGPNTVVLDCSVIFFNPKEKKTFQELLNDVHYWKFDVASQIKDGRIVTKDTMDWWEKQPPEARRVLSPSPNDISLDQFVKELEELCSGKVSKNSISFCRGQDFDFPLLDNIVQKHSSHKRHFLCEFWNQRDIRSYISGMMLNPLMVRYPLDSSLLEGFVKHDSRHDVAKAVVEMLEIRRLLSEE